MTGVTVIGCVQVDLLLAPVLDVPPPGTSAFVDQLSLRVGGAGANTALALLEAGAGPRLVGVVGDDHFGRWILEQLDAFGLAEDVAVDPAQPTGLTVAIEAPARERSFLTHLGVTGTAGPEIVPESSLAAGHVLICDYFCAPALRGEPTRRLFTTARALGARTYFDTAWDTAGFPPATREELYGILPLVDVFLPNEAEACALAGVESVAKAGRDLQRRSGGWVVIKLGADGCVAYGPHGGRLQAGAPAIAPEDTTGAGDAFNAGLLAALAAGRDLPDALEAANGLATSLLARPSNGRHTVRR
ncbi:MAG TPA: carbohydrate kinase family protein [Solirubrobacter sp.]|nr:carbohydrate kinase family protein [Solirubrobacter sp.]